MAAPKRYVPCKIAAKQANVAANQGRFRQQEHPENRWLQTESQDVLAGHAGLKIPGIIDAEQTGRCQSQQPRMNRHEQRDKTQPG